MCNLMMRTRPKAFLPLLFAAMISGATFSRSAVAQTQTNTSTDRLSIPSSEPMAFSKVKPEEIDAMLAFIPDIVASVDGKKITGRQLKGIIAPTIGAAIAAGSAPPSDQELKSLVAQVTKQLVDQQILFKVSQEQGYAPDFTAAESKISEIKEKIGIDKFMAALERQGNTLEEVRDHMACIAAFNLWIQEKLAAKISVDEDELKHFYDANLDVLKTPAKVEVAHILIALLENSDQSEQTKAEAYNKINKLRQLIENGADFAQIAKVHSDCPSAKNGGRLEPFGRNEMVKEFEDAAFALKEQELSTVVKTAYGLHLIKCLKQIESKQIPFEECRRELSHRLVNHKLSQALEEEIKDVVPRTEIKIFISHQ